MTEYTPTTEEVREAFVSHGESAWFPTADSYDEWKDAGGAEGEFDRWLAERDRQVAERAWDEGARHVYEGGKCSFARDGDPCPYNPYRKESTADWPPPKSRDEIRKGAIDEIAKVLEKKEATSE
ncbi:hypothetical protein Pan2_58 [Pseudanabaena phage Pan2]|nr:hypothetical protein Pan2_58 [Pseudanabaena phage Pan2]